MKKTFLTLLLCASLGYSQEAAITQSGRKVILFSDGTYKYVEITEATPIIRTVDEDDKLLKKEDFKSANGRMLVSDFECNIQNDDSADPVLVSVICQQKAFDKIGVDKINIMLLTANEKVRSSLKENHRYIPKEIKMAYIPGSNDFSLTNLFTVQDEDGEVRERLLSVDFDSDGNFAGMKNIL